MIKKIFNLFRNIFRKKTTELEAESEFDKLNRRGRRKLFAHLKSSKIRERKANMQRSHDEAKKAKKERVARQIAQHQKI